MFHRLRLAWIIFRMLFEKRGRQASDTFECPFWVTPCDTELFSMASNQYLAMMNLGRWHYVLHTLSWREALRCGAVPFTYSEHIRYKRSLKLGQKVILKTRLLCWDDQKVYFEQRFERDGELIAMGYACGAMYATRGNKKGFVSPCQSLRGLEGSPPFPELVVQWRALDVQINNSFTR